ncbi:sigma-70 family RNA polymerase sigma factor [Brumicola blandensis]|uniref:Sigma-70 family RNA polymerase sigma factor n=1 Tax=Brumicola blandensis TaxID=3075611 RepID=A0AAW8R294_9ALTE|nr:sigma-70 family RNA polymerase sigma factor [Alteromonas sp. W409]MDT0582205.1 sigma-70 family RNA polymerase sigma factor [Alteromonas sp. W409]
MEHEELLPLLLKVARNDRPAFEAIYNKTSGQVYAVALKMLAKPELAEEATQEAFVRIWYNASQYTEGKGTVLTWIISIVRYRALDILRYRKVRKEEGVADLDSIPSSNIEASESESDHETGKLSRCMNELDHMQRQAIHLAYFNGCSHGEVVAHMEKPLGTIKSWIRRGLQALERCLSL